MSPLTFAMSTATRNNAQTFSRENLWRMIAIEIYATPKKYLVLLLDLQAQYIFLSST